MANPTDIGINPPALRPYPVRGGLATGTGCTYGMIAIADNGTNNFRDVKLSSALKDTAIVGPVTTANAVGTAGEAIELGQNGAVCEVWLAAGATCAKEGEAICVGDGTVTPIASNTGAMGIVGRFKQNATAGASAILVALEVAVYTKTVA